MGIAHPDHDTFITCGTALRLRVPSLSSVVNICVHLHKAILISESSMVGKFGSSGDSKQIFLYQLPISLRNNPLPLPQDGRVVQGTFICYDYQVDSKAAALRPHTRTTAPHATKRRHSPHTPPLPGETPGVAPHRPDPPPPRPRPRPAPHSAAP
jgi:hypothetical protein